MKPVFLISVVFFLAVPNMTWAAGNQVSRTLTINSGMGVNNGSNKNLSTSNNPGTVCSGGNTTSCGSFGGLTGPFADTSDPFNSNDDCSPSGFGDFCSSAFDPSLPGGFNLVDNRFGRGAPCGPNDHSGPPFPYPCQTKGSINQIIPLGIDDSVSTRTHTLTPPSLGGVGQPFYQFRSDTFGTLRVHHIEYGFDFDEDNEQQVKVFFTVDSITDANGQMVGNAVGTFRMTINDNFGNGTDCSLTTGNASEGRFESGMTGVITCVDKGGNPCQSSQFIPTLFSRSSGAACP